MSITVTIDEADFLEMLVNEVKKWTDDEDTIELFEQYYDHMVYGGCFEGTSRSIAEIVDNDYVNNTSIMTEEEYTKEREEFIKESMDSDGFSSDDEPKAEDYTEPEDYQEDLQTFEEEKAEALQQYEEDIPTWEELETGEAPDFINGGYIEAKTNNSMLISN